MNEKKMNNLYFVTVEWYDEYHDEDKTSHILVIAKSIHGAVRKASQDFNYVNSIKVENWADGNVHGVYLPNDWDWNLISRLKDENNY